MLSPLQTSSTTPIDDRTLRAYLKNSTAWTLDESAPGPGMDQWNLASSGHGDRFLNTSVNFPNEMRSANLNDMVSNIVEENSEYHQNAHMPAYAQYPTASMMMPPSAWSSGGPPDQHLQYMQSIKNAPSRQIKHGSSSLSESGHPRNIPDACAMGPHSPRDIQVLVRKGDLNGINSLVTHMPLQQFRQMIGLQSSSGFTNPHDRRMPSSSRHSDNRRPYPTMHNPHMQPPPLSSSSSSSSSSIPASNLRLINGPKQQENKKWSHEALLQQQQQQSYPSMQHIDRQHSPMPSHESMPGATMHETNLVSPMSACQDISFYRSNRRTGVANTLHIAIEKCYEQLNYIRDSYAETESKISIQILPKSPSPSSMMDLTNKNFATLSNNPSRVDRLIAEYHYEYTRIIRLHERVKEGLTVQDVEATRQTLDEWLNAINIVHDRRRQEIDNAAEKCRSGEPRLPDEKDVLQLAEALRILRITTRKIRTVLWYWLYWSTNSTTNKTPLIARHRDEPLVVDPHEYYSSLITDNYKQIDPSLNLFYPSTNNDFSMGYHMNEDESALLAHPIETHPAGSDSADEQGKASSKKKPPSLSSNENNKENECNE